MPTKRKTYTLGETGFWPTWISKLLFTLISVKVWGLIAGTMVSTWLLLLHAKHQPVLIGGQVYEFGINGAQWVTFNTTIWALIFGMKEIFKISESRDLAEKENIQLQSESKIKLANIAASGAKDKKTRSAFTADWLEIVGEEPGELI